jgi:hypothetical protein
MMRPIKARLRLSIAIAVLTAAGAVGALIGTGHPTLLSNPTAASHYHPCHKHC